MKQMELVKNLKKAYTHDMLVKAYRVEFAFITNIDTWNKEFDKLSSKEIILFNDIENYINDNYDKKEFYNFKYDNENESAEYRLATIAMAMTL